MLLDGNTLHSRESLAGYDRARMETGVVVLVGCGAAGSNLAQTLALSGVGELRLIDPDVVELSNLTRSPLFRRERIVGGRARPKVRELAQGVLALSTALSPRVRTATRPVEALGYGAFRGASVVVSALDSLVGRAYLADVTRELGVPLVELGFGGHEGHVSVFPNAAPEEPCWRCLHPRAGAGRFSCRTYAEAVVARGMVPATQPLAATFSSLAAEAAIGALHGRFELGGQHLGLDIRTGRTTRLEITAAPSCPGAHRDLRPEVEVEVWAKQPLTELFAALGGVVAEPVLHLPMPYVVHAPCVRCGSEVSVQRPAWMLDGAPRCARGCAARPMLGAGQMMVVDSVRPQDPLAARPCLALGLAPATLVEVEDMANGRRLVLRLAGELDDLYVTRTRETASPSDEPVARKQGKTGDASSDPSGSAVPELG